MAGRPTTPVRIRLLGPVQAWRGARELDLGSAHRRAVFAVLAMRANYTVSREEIIDAVWGEAAPASAAGGVYTYVSALRHVLEPARGRRSADRILSSGGGGYCLHTPDTDVDVHAFERLRDSARRLRTAGDTEGERGTLRDALDLWHGEALNGIPGPFAHNQRVRLGELRLATLERHATLDLEAGQHDDVIGGLRALTAEHPLRESLHALLMTALHRANRPAEAVDVYRQLHDTLVEDSGTEPSAALRQLYEQILHTAVPEPAARPIPRQRAVVTSPAPDVRPSGRPPFVGREPELTALRAAVERLAGGQGGCMWIEGEPGIGKSALLSEGIGELAGWQVGRGVGDELAQRMPLSVLVECLDLQPETAELQAAVDAFRSAAAHSADDATAVALDHAQQLVQQLCAHAPLVLVIDDLQWTDDWSLLGWHHLHRLTRRLPLLLVAACRPAPRRHRLNLLRTVLADAGAEVVTLGPMTADESTELVRAVAPGRIGPALPDIAGELAAGNPHYLKAVVGAAIRGDVLPLGQRAAVGVSPMLAATVADHLDLLSEDTRDVVRAAAFLDGECTVAEISAVTGKAIPSLIAAVEEALAAGVLVESGANRLTFRHPLVRRVLHDGTPTAIRVTVHRDFAEKIAAGTGAPERVADLLLGGPAAMDAWSHRWLDANLERLHRRDRALALQLLRHAATQPDVPMGRRIVLTARLARLLLRDGLAADLDAGWVVAHAADRDLVAEMRWIVAVSHHRLGRHVAATGVVRNALRDATTPSKWRGRFMALLSRVNPHVNRHPGPHRLRARRRTAGTENRGGRTRRHGTLVVTGPG